jgi:hypothetical protein
MPGRSRKPKKSRQRAQQAQASPKPLTPERKKKFRDAIEEMKLQISDLEKVAREGWFFHV